MSGNAHASSIASFVWAEQRALFIIANLPRPNSSSSPPNVKLAAARSDITVRKGNIGARVGRRQPGSFGAAMSVNAPTTHDWSTSYQASSSGSASGMSTEDDDTDDDTRTVVGRRDSVSVESRNGGADVNRKPPRAPSPAPPASSSDGSKAKANGRTSTLSRRTFTRSRSPAPSSLGLNGIMPQPRPPSPTAFLRPRTFGPTGFVLPATAVDPVLTEPPPTPRLSESRAPRRATPIIGPPISENRGYVWMTVPKNYRTSSDDGLVTGLIFGPLITSALYYVALRFDTQAAGTSQPPIWYIEAPWHLGNDTSLTPPQALVLSRRNAVDLSTLSSLTLSIHVYASHWFEWRYRKQHKVSEGERGSVPRSEARKGWLYAVFTYLVCAFLLGLRFALDRAELGIWKHLSYWEIASGSIFFQFSLYFGARLAHRGFTLGELGLVVFGGTALFTELVNLTVARIWPVTTVYIKTYRLPTPLLIYQLALVPGSLLTGFLLSPLLTLSRHIAQRPVRRMRFPHEKQAHRRALAVGFYLGAALVVGGLIGMWTRWLLRGRDPWLWVVFWLLEGPRQWTRPALLTYWAVLGSISVWGWNRQLARSRRFRPRLPTVGEAVTEDITVTQQGSEPTTPMSGALGLASSSLTSSAVSASTAVSAMFPTVAMPHLPTDLGLGASEWLDAADRRVPTLGLNARRKFFHALAVVMFVPGVAADPAFTHLAFSAAFALFVFAEYVRYFALYPFGAAVHVFMSEFLDSKDTGTAILSHFYLLTGCAGALWFEGPSRLLMYTGVLTVGVGDAVASVVGKRVGRYKWSPTTSKTLEGSAGFTISVVAFAWILRLCGLVEEFSTVRYGTIIGLGSVLEAMSGQNDNIILPVYVWSMLGIGLLQTGLTVFPTVLLPTQSAANSRSSPSLSLLPNAPLVKQKRASRSAQRSLTTSLNSIPNITSSPSQGSTPSATDPPHKSLRSKSSYHQSLLDLRDELQKRSESASLPRALDMSSPGDSDASGRTEPSEHDWATFVAAYALGSWDPREAPQPPRSCLGRQYQSPSLAGSPPDISSDSRLFLISPSGTTSPSQKALPASTQGAASPRALSDVSTSASRKADTPPQTTSPTSAGSSAPSTPGSSLLARGQSTSRRSSTSNISPSIPHRLRSSFADIRSSTGSRPTLDPPLAPTVQPVVPHSEATTTAAAMRWAAAGVSIAPLALPSPEHELTDPFRNARTAIPSSYLPEVPSDPQAPRHRRRLGSFWEGTIDVDRTTQAQSILGSIQGSPSSTPPTADSSDFELEPTSASTTTVSPPYATPTSAPLRPGSGYDDDYFGFAGLSASPGSSATVSPPQQHTSSDSEAAQIITATRRANLTRQPSLSFPNKFVGSLAEASPPARSTDAGVGRVLNEEAMFLELGYLIPPYPPDEFERRRALYQFNIWNTGPDTNFERIEHLTKLVFSTKTVIICLIDENEQYRLPLSRMTSSYCSGDEPMVVLDTRADWRFAKNPLVIGPPHVRFYAGAPLRTQDGYNVGTLAIMDDEPRVEFNPRQRHTLKEFAAIAMREMELWRDKIQLRIRDRIQTSMEQFTRECLEIDSETSSETEATQPMKTRLSMDRVYQHAAKLVKKTLDVEGALVMDMSHGEILETVAAEAAVSLIVHSAEDTTTHQVQGDACIRMWDLFLKYPDGRAFEAVVPPPLRPFVPNETQYTLCKSSVSMNNSAIGVPIFNIDRRPFAMLCAYNSSEHGRRYLEGHELSYLRAIGVIILSAVLKRRMTLADKAKSLFISNISHELRTPLHGILAAAELLADTQLNHTQSSFLQTVQACGTSLVETVNHVLDFTKLSGNAKAGGVEHVIRTTKINVLQLIEEAVEGSWIGHRARTFIRQQESEIGSLYAPPRQDGSGKKLVEVVIEIGDREEGWLLRLEKGGIRRVLMNVFGNSLKFTTDGYVHVIIRQLPSTPDVPLNKVKLELVVADTGKGISQDFLKNQLFHPFSQENPMQTGTGLGLAIVNSIVQSKGVDGKVDVWSAENVGTEIKVTFSAQIVEDASPKVSDTLNPDPEQPVRVGLVGFDDPHRGVQLLRKVLTHYLVSWWKFQIAPPGSLGDIVVTNEDLSALQLAIERRDIRQPFVLLTVSRGEKHLMTTVTEFERLGGFCRILYKPGGPSRLRQALKHCIHALKISRRPDSPPIHVPVSVARRNSEEPGHTAGHSDVRRPALGRRSITVHPVAAWSAIPAYEEEDDGSQEGVQLSRMRSLSQSQSTTSPTIPVGDTGGSLLRSSVGALGSRNNVRVLVVEDNSILRNLLIRWLSSKGYEYREAVDGREGVQLFESDGHFDVILLDMSMPILDGYGATMQIRKIEASRSGLKSSYILALTGMSTLEDKRKAFEAGVDGYLVKPVAFKTLSEMFGRLGIT
ncbi:Fph type histidine kinase [Lactarius akahatsu]|uniref:dolichol kinase n=1 Tax=Lactarius akahatsu TaxID=416441 RepID=A0AAD4Q6X5_9AGAM|nr:Fph type histidine kinase [Lactarius akahatsu]